MPKGTNLTSEEISARIDKLAAMADKTTDDNVKVEDIKRTVALRLPNPLLTTSIFFLFWFICSLTVYTNSGNQIVMMASPLLTFHPAALNLVSWFDANVLSILLGARMKSILFLFLGPMLVCAHIGEASVAFRRLMLARRTFGQQSVALHILLLYTVGVFILGFPLLKCMAAEIAEVRASAAKLARLNAEKKNSTTAQAAVASASAVTTKKDDKAKKED